MKTQTTQMNRLMILIAVLCLYCTNAFADDASMNTIEGKRLAVTYDANKWRFIDLDMSDFGIPDAFQFSYQPFEENTLIMFNDMDYDAEQFFQQQVMKRKNSMFRDAVLAEEYKQSTLWGKPIYHTTFQKILADTLFSGHVMVANQHGGIIVIITLSTNTSETGEFELMKGISFISDAPKRSMEEQLQDQSTLINEHKRVMTRGLVMEEMMPNTKKKTITYTLVFTELEKKDVNKSTTLTKEAMLTGLENEYDINVLTQKLMANGYTFIHLFLDKHHKKVRTITLTPKDYQYILNK